MPPPSLPGMHVGVVNLHLRHTLECLQGVMQGVGVVGPGAGVNHDTSTITGFTHEAHHLALVIRLPELEIYVREPLTQSPFYVAEGQGPVDLRPARPQGSQVHSVEDEHPSQPKPPRQDDHCHSSWRTGRQTPRQRPCSKFGSTVEAIGTVSSLNPFVYGIKNAVSPAFEYVEDERGGSKYF